MSPRAVTTVICARNAERTIARAVRSAIAQTDRLLLVDDFSSDDTVAHARAVVSIDVISPARHGTMGETRQAGLTAVTTPFLVWLDADDELLPGRIQRLIDAMDRDGADVATDNVEIVDGVTGALRGIAHIPGFVRQAPIRVFERMYLPGPGVIAVRTPFAQRLGYDATLHGCEDVDFLLRALVTGGRLTMVDEVGYRLYAYPNSLSRDRDRQRQMYRAALGKHDYDRIAARYAASGVNPIITAWALTSIAMFREDYAAAWAWIARAEAAARPAPAAIVEPDGPCPHPESWRVAFARGTVHLLRQEPAAAVAQLQLALTQCETAETLNNLGVALAQRGDGHRVEALFARALAQRPGYADAIENLASATPSRITTHPLRVETARQDYPAVTSCTPDATAR
jgi:glycosyltransferase involved in cell wall biosynthesis